jgi:hypothetical protein
VSATYKLADKFHPKGNGLRTDRWTALHVAAIPEPIHVSQAHGEEVWRSSV